MPGVAGPRSQDPRCATSGAAAPGLWVHSRQPGGACQSEAPTRAASQLRAFPAPAFIYGGNLFLLLPHPSPLGAAGAPSSRGGNEQPEAAEPQPGRTEGHGDVTRTAPSPPSPALPVPPRPRARRTGAAARPGTAWPQHHIVPAPTSARVFEERRNERELSAHPARAGDGVGPARAASPFDK